MRRRFEATGDLMPLWLDQHLDRAEAVKRSTRRALVFAVFSTAFALFAVGFNVWNLARKTSTPTQVEVETE